MSTQSNMQRIVIENRERLQIGQVKSVLSFDEDYLKINSELGIIVVEGKELIIENLSKERGEILVKGRIDSIEFIEGKKKR